MTHTLHREGTPENLKDDFVVIIRPERGINSEGSAEKLRAILRIFKDNNAVNIGNVVGTGNIPGNIYCLALEKIDEALKDGDAIYGVFAKKSDVINFLRDIVAKDFGISVVVQGLYDDVADCCHQVGLKVHTTNHSLGVWGKTQKLPPKEIRELTTMCGHGMVPASLVKDVLDDIRAGRLSIHEGALKLTKPCGCGIFNPVRAEKLLADLQRKI